MNPFSSFMMGRHLVKLTDIFEANKRLEMSNPVGMGGIESLPQVAQERVLKELSERKEKLKNYPPYDLTKAIIMNAEMNARMSDNIRIEAISQLYDALVEEGIALSTEEFEVATGLKKL